MVSKLIAKRSSVLIFSTLFLVACGGGGDGGGDSNTSSDTNESSEPSVPETVISEPIVSEPIVSDSDSDTQIPDESEEEQESDDPVDTNPVIPDNSVAAAQIADDKIRLARTNCGLNGLSDDSELGAVAIKHANYIKYVFANSTPTVFNAHREGRINDIANVTGNNNPFFGGITFGQRLSNAGYTNVFNGVTENIAQTVYYSSANNIVTPNVAALSMTKSLLAAPYHLRSLMTPSANQTSSSFVAYEPHDKLGFQNAKGYVLVNHAAVTSASKDNTVAGVFTYPCQGVTGTVTALYNESPNPFRGPNGVPTRDLRNNPIGQPIYVNMPSAQTIKVSNVRFLDIKRNLSIPIKQIDFDADPYKGTNFELPANEAFIMPLTDSLKSCEAKRTQNQSQQCGLYGNSEYRVSFDVLVDNKDMQSKSFIFKTGNVSY